MIAEVGSTPVADDELLARYIVRKDHVRADGTVKPDPFIPFKHVELSVTRHRGLNEEQIWSAGELVARDLKIPLLGRADIRAEVPRSHGLKVVQSPQEENPNHADVVGWPADKPAQKELALLIARSAEFKPKIPSGLCK